MKHSLIAAMTLALTASLVGCGGGDPKAETTTTAPNSAPSDPTSSTKTGGPPPNWQSKFSASELAGGQRALVRWKEWRELSAEIYKKGRLTPGAEDSLKEYDFWWQRDTVTLGETYDKGDLRRVTDVQPLWAYVKSVRLSNHGKTGQVVVVECTDYRPLRYTRNGKPQKIHKPKHQVTPLWITMTKPDGRHDWMYFKTSLKDKTSCAPE